MWVILLAGGQFADLLTTRIDMARGGIEGNWMTAALLDAGGMPLLLVVKCLLVGAMAVAVTIVSLYAASHPGDRSRLASLMVWRGLQLCVIVLAATSLHNVVVLAELQGWAAAGVLGALLT